MTFRATALVSMTAIGIVVAVAGCTKVAPLPTPTPVISPSGNQDLRILDAEVTSGDTAAWAAAQEAGTELAIREINEAGGVFGKPVTVWHRTDASPAAVTEVAASLKIDAVIVAPSPATLEALLAPAAKAKVAVVGIGTVTNLATPTAKPYPDASLPPASSATSSSKKGATTAPSTAATAPTTTSATSVPTHKAGAPATPDAPFVGRLKSSNPFLTDTTYGAESYQLTVALALAALVSKDDAGPSLISGLEQVTLGDVVCGDFVSCRTVLLDNRAIKYVGPAGRMAFDSRTGVVTFGS